jgi:hypothetical protein
MHTSPKDWSLESRELAIEKGYLRGTLQGGTNAATAPSLPADYTKNAKAVAEHQATLAGYRLAEEIHGYLKCGGVVPPLPENTNAIVQIEIPAKIGAAEAAKNYDETLVVTGKVVDVSVRPTITILDLDQPYPNTTFTAVVFPENAAQFGDMQRFKNQSVEIYGTVTEYRNKPEIILKSPDQLKVLDGK